MVSAGAGRTDGNSRAPAAMTLECPQGVSMKHRLDRAFVLGVVVALILSLVAPPAARAQATALSDEQVKERLAFIETALEAGRPRAETWFYGWLGAYSVGSLAGGILAGSHWTDTKVEGAETVNDREYAEGMLVGGATFLLGVGSLVVNPFKPALVPDELRAVPESSMEERRAKLERAEKMLRDCARQETAGRGLGTHLLNLGANAAGAVVIKAAFRQSWRSALVNFAGGEAISLLNIFTQPMRAVRDLKAYEAKFQDGKGAAEPAPAAPRWSLSVSPAGFTLRYEF